MCNGIARPKIYSFDKSALLMKASCDIYDQHYETETRADSDESHLTQEEKECDNFYVIPFETPFKPSQQIKIKTNHTITAPHITNYHSPQDERKIARRYRFLT